MAKQRSKFVEESVEEVPEEPLPEEPKVETPVVPTVIIDGSPVAANRPPRE